jgi:hypothetical protein
MIFYDYLGKKKNNKARHVPCHIQGGSTVTVKMMNRDRNFLLSNYYNALLPMSQFDR